jgi:hypothetical protein
MYRDSPQGLQRMNYCNEVHDLINYTLYNMRNISGEGITCPCKKCKNKKVSRSRCCNDASSTKKVHEELPMLVCIYNIFFTIL